MDYEFTMRSPPLVSKAKTNESKSPLVVGGSTMDSEAELTFLEGEVPKEQDINLPWGEYMSRTLHHL